MMVFWGKISSSVGNSQIPLWKFIMILQDGFELPHGVANHPKILKRYQL